MQLGDHFRELAAGLSDLMAKHLELARLELQADARAVGASLGRILLLVPLVFVGGVMLSVSAALYLHRSLDADVAFLVVGLVDLVGGGAALALVIGKLRSLDLLKETRAELDATVATLKARQREELST